MLIKELLFHTGHDIQSGHITLAGLIGWLMLIANN
jgi:hypothetical protein